MKFLLTEDKANMMNELANAFDMSTAPIMGPSYIFPDGRFIIIPEPEEMGAAVFVHYKCHSLLHLWLVSKKLTKKTIWDINGMTDILDAGAIKVNLGPIPDADALLNYIELPKKRPTSAQFSALIDWLDLAQQNGIDSIEVNTYNQGNYKSYPFSDNTSDEIVANIKRYYGSGALYEGVSTDGHKYYLCGTHGLVGTPYPNPVTREEAERKLASGHLLSSWGYVHERFTYDDGIRREVMGYPKLLTTPEDFDNIEAKIEKRFTKKEGFTESVNAPIRLNYKLIESPQRQDAIFNGERFWIGSASTVDGVIEEVHTYEEAEQADFHHTFTFSEAQVEKINNGENITFWVTDNDIDSWEEIPPTIKRKIVDQIEFDSPLNEDVLTEDIAAVRKNFPSISDEDFNRLIRLDPTFDENRDAVGTYGKWILTLFKKGKLSNEGHVRDALSRFEEEKKYLKNRDIGQFKSLEEIDAYLDNDDNYKTLSHRQEVRQRQNDRKNVDVTKDAIKVYESANWVVWIPKTYAASCKLGQGSSWCTASTESDYYYNYYTKYGDLYINKHKTDENEMYQFHFQTSSYMDKDDSPVDLYYFLQDNPELKEFYYDIVAKSLNLDMKADKCEVTFTEDELHDLISEWDKRYCTRNQVGYYGIKMILNGDTWEWFDYPFELPYDLPTPSKYVIAELDRLNLTVEDLEDIFNGDSELDIADDVLDCLKHANYQASVDGAEAEMWDDLTKALSYPGGAGEGFFSSYAGRELTIVASPNAVMKVYMETLGGNIEETGELFGDNLKNILGYMWMSDFSFYEPQYGWSGFDEDSFNERLSEELANIDDPDEDDDQLSIEEND